MGRFRNLEFDSSNSDESHRHQEEMRDAQYWKQKADSEYQNQWYENALRFYSRTLEMDVGQVSAWVGQARCLIWLAEYPEAELWASKALERFKENGDLIAALSQCNCRMHHFGQSQELSDRAMKATGDTAYRWMVRGEILLSRRQSTADFCFQRAIQADAHWSTAQEIGNVFLFWEYPAKAVPWFRKTTECAPDQPTGWLQLGRAQRKLRQTGAARRTLTECLKICPGHRDVNAELADLDRTSDDRSWFGKIRRMFE